jgi:hypothetical protein
MGSDQKQNYAAWQFNTPRFSLGSFGIAAASVLRRVMPQYFLTIQPTWKVTSQGLKGILAITLVGIVMVSIYNYFTPLRWGEEQAQSRYEAAIRHALVLKPLIKKDARFSKISLDGCTCEGGCLTAVGEVASNSDLLNLKHLVESSGPPVKVYYQVSTPSNFFNFIWQPVALASNPTAKTVPVLGKALR